MRNVRIVLPMTGAALVTGLIFFCFGRTYTVDDAVAGQIEIVLGEPDITAANILSEADSLRVALKFREAMAAYEALLDKGGLNEASVKEARYDIGLCHLWLGEYDAAKTAMNALIYDYGGDGNAVGHARYCLAWIDEQEGRYGEALATIDLALKSGEIDDAELAARLLFKTGKIRLAYLGDTEAAQRIFK